MTITLGNTVRDRVTGFVGIAIARVHYLNGCIQFGVRPKAKDNKTEDSQYIDINQLEKVDDGIAVEQKETGGIMSDQPTSGIGLARN